MVLHRHDMSIGMLLFEAARIECPRHGANLMGLSAFESLHTDFLYRCPYKPGARHECGRGANFIATLTH